MGEKTEKQWARVVLTGRVLLCLWGGLWRQLNVSITGWVAERVGWWRRIRSTNWSLICFLWSRCAYGCAHECVRVFVNTCWCLMYTSANMCLWICLCVTIKVLIFLSLFSMYHVCFCRQRLTSDLRPLCPYSHLIVRSRGLTTGHYLLTLTLCSRQALTSKAGVAGTCATLRRILAGACSTTMTLAWPRLCAGWDPN